MKHTALVSLLFPFYTFALYRVALNVKIHCTVKTVPPIKSYAHSVKVKKKIVDMFNIEPITGRAQKKLSFTLYLFRLKMLLTG